MSPWLIYWITRLDAISGMFLTLTVVGAFVFFITGAIVVIDPPRDTKTSLKVLRWFAPITILSMIMATLVPTTKEMSAILIIPAVANSETVQEIKDLAIEWLQDQRQNITK